MHGLTHVAGGADPIPGFAKIPTGDTIDAIISGFDPAGWWKLNEDSGSVAADSSGNGLDMTVDAGRVNPVWGQPAGPPGEQTADFETGASTTYARVQRTWAALSGDFTAGIFVTHTSATLPTQVFGQGNPSRAGGTGWMLWILGSDVTYTSHPAIYFGGVGSIFADNPLPVDTWAMLAVVHDGTEWRLNVNGLDQASTHTGSYTASSSPLWIGHDAGYGGFADTLARFTGSYAFLIPDVLAGADLLSIYEAATLPEGASAGKVLTATGLGGTTWEFPIPQDGNEGDVLTIVGGVPTWAPP